MNGSAIITRTMIQEAIAKHLEKPFDDIQNIAEIGGTVFFRIGEEYYMAKVREKCGELKVTIQFDD